MLRAAYGTVSSQVARIITISIGHWTFLNGEWFPDQNVVADTGGNMRKYRSPLRYDATLCVARSRACATGRRCTVFLTALGEAEEVHRLTVFVYSVPPYGYVSQMCFGEPTLLLVSPLQLGGGAFGNELEWITDAVRDAATRHAGAPLDVKMAGGDIYWRDLIPFFFG